MPFQYQSLCVFFLKNHLEKECFPNGWKKAIAPAYKKGEKQLINNYWKISLLAICAKVFEKIIFNSLFEYLDTNKLLNNNQSGFCPGNLCVHHLLSITHEIYKAIDSNPSLEVRGVLLDLLKVFGRVWQGGLMYKIKCLGICGKYYRLIQSFSGEELFSMDNPQNGVTLKLMFPRGTIIGPLFL